MHGLFGSYGKKADWLLERADRLLYRQYDSGKFHIEQSTLRKFTDDKTFAEYEGVFFCLEGVVLNKTELEEMYGAATMGEVLLRLYREQGEGLVRQLRGSFCLVVYDIARDKCLLYNDQIGDKMLFYTYADGSFYWAADWRRMRQVLGETVPSERFYATMLTYGYSPLGDAPIDYVKRLQAGQYLRIQRGAGKVMTYHRFYNGGVGQEENRLPIERNAELTDRYFRQAVGRILRKNEEYGYEHWMPLSAGLDSRMTVVVARDMTNAPIHNITYSQTGYYDDVVPKEIAESLGNEMHFTALDGGEYLKQIDHTMDMTEGLVYYAGAAQVWEGVNRLPRERMGVIGTGLIGELSIGTRERHRKTPFVRGEGMVSQRLLALVPPIVEQTLRQTYTDKELYMLYIRAFNCANLGSPLVFQHFTESMSPFYDVDLLEFEYSVPPSQRWNYRLYDRWISSYYPQAMRWRHNGEEQIGNRPWHFMLLGRDMTLRSMPKRGIDYVRRRWLGQTVQEGGSMNPMERWWQENGSLRQVLDDYVRENIHLLDFAPALRRGAQEMYSGGSMFEKVQVITALSSLRNF